jgi:hypothetical protein
VCALGGCVCPGPGAGVCVPGLVCLVVCAWNRVRLLLCEPVCVLFVRVCVILVVRLSLSAAWLCDCGCCCGCVTVAVQLPSTAAWLCDYGCVTVAV